MRTAGLMGDPIRGLQIFSAILQFWRIMGPDYPATQKELCDYSRLFLDRTAGYKPKDGTVVRVLRQLVASGFIESRTPQPKAILYWMAAGKVDPLFPAYDRDAAAALRARDPFPVFTADGRAFLIARRGTSLPNAVPVHLRKPHLGAFMWWRACHHARSLLGSRFANEADRAARMAVQSAQQAILGFVWACNERRADDARSARVAEDFGASRERHVVRPEHDFGATCPADDCSIGQAAQRALESIESLYANAPGLQGLRPVYRDLDQRIRQRALNLGRNVSGPGTRSEHVQSDELRGTIKMLKGSAGPAAALFQQWERAWSSGFRGAGGSANGQTAPNGVKPTNEARARCILMVRGEGRDPAEAARETGTSVSHVATWLEEFDRVALVAPHVGSDKVPRATGLARPSCQAYLALWTEIAVSEAKAGP